MSVDDMMSAQRAVDEARERFARMIDEGDRVARETAEMAQEIQAREYSAWSRGREVRATVGPDGLIVELEFSPSAPSLSPATLSRVTLEAHDRALKLLRDTVEEITARAVPSAPELARATAAEYRHVVPARVDLLPDDDRR